ncbi:hypothetical protein B0I26_10732 [Anoxybacillus vitaminiphilus]|jgi:hypothetical protein|uniref:PepSY-associated transmembrane protein n=1 Tax=Paranoxybacillus vitaminiphilus TaxID=581036 RepID=A0A327YH38_9BACL|nr:PepSY-associated TM helix domain-containing protein [Anoxybacillus vitaminiphilus]RAK19115.1 hypothetical protein B0I26_10732 [Anoxybacillus vitaminiphilus]
MKKMRQAHLWIGLITSVFLLMEAVTGLLLAEPWLIGQQPKGEPMLMQGAEQGQISAGMAQQGPSSAGNFAEGESSSSPDFEQRSFGPREGFRGERGGNSLAGIIRGLHEGRLGNIDIRWAIDIAAISMIFLTLSGIYLSVKLLRAQRKSRKKRSLKIAEGQ